MKTLIKKSILASLIFSSFAIAQEPAVEVTMSFDDWKATFSSALPAGDSGKRSTQATNKDPRRKQRGI